MNNLSLAPVFLAQAETDSSSALLVFGIYTLLVFGLAYFSHQVLVHRKFLSEYFLGSRGLGVLAFTLTYGATSASAGSFAGFPSLIYLHGWTLALWIASYMVVPLCGMGLLGKRMNQVARRAGAITLPDLLRERFGHPIVGTIATVVIVCLLTVYLIPQFKLSALILRELLADSWLFRQLVAALPPALAFGSEGPDYTICLLFFAILTIAYTAFGGFRAVVWTDMLQGLIMIFGIVVMLSLALWQVGGMQSLTDKMKVMTPPEIGEVAFQLPDTALPEDLPIPTRTWFLHPHPETQEPALFRTNQLALISKGTTESESVKVVRITTRSEVERVLSQFEDRTPPPLPERVEPVIKSLNEYAYGANRTGVYVSPPGPSPEMPAGFLPFGLAISFFCFWALSNTGQPGNMVRLMAFDSATTLRRSVGLLSLYFTLVYIPLVIIFCCARVLEPGLDQVSDEIMPRMAFNLSETIQLPWLAGLLLAAPFAAAMSTVDSFMLIVSSGVVRDVYQRQINPDASEKTVKRLSYICTLSVGIVVTIAALNPPELMQKVIVFTGGALSVTFLIPVALALYWPRFNLPGVIASIAVGLLVYLVLQYLVSYSENKHTWQAAFVLHPLIWGYAASLLGGILVSLFTPRPPDELVRKFFYPAEEK